MAKENSETTTFDALSKVASTLSPFISFAFMLIAYIYTNNQSDNQAKLNDIAKEQKEIKEALSELKSTINQHSSRMDRQGERIDEAKKSVSEVEQSQRDLEKSVLLYNANRR